jgi:uncharacterized membrane protein HdeD (DUF308 family)
MRTMTRLQIMAMDQPGWVWRVALGVVAFIIVLPVILLVMLALATGVMVFGALALASMAARRVRDAFGLAKRDGRENVRVIVRRD